MRKSRLSQHKQYKLIELFVAGVTARTAAELININKTTAALYLSICEIKAHYFTKRLSGILNPA